MLNLTNNHIYALTFLLLLLLLYDYIFHMQMAPGKEESFQLFCCIQEATMIHKAAASKPIRFEMNIGKLSN